jgi:DNA mismatch repair protein MutL
VSEEKIKLLGEEVARRIAAGEVIDRPAAVVRELLDNSIDAGSGKVTVSIEQGGIAHIRVVDNGTGMSADDLERCFLPHATSKIEAVDDLMQVTSLGFRGEALASIGACSRLEIVSKTEDQQTAYRLIVKNGKKHSLEPYRGTNGTIVDVRDLFYSIPARKKFLKSSSAETSLCKAVLLEKALPFPNIAFDFSTDGNTKLTLPQTSLRERVIACFGQQLAPDLVFEETEKNGELSITLIGARPELHRKDRKLIQVFANNRRIFDYSFMQAVEYGYSEHMPGGNHPIAFVFITLPPSLVDFNIHPAKKEARFRNHQELHHSIAVLVKNALKQYAIQPGHSSVQGRTSTSVSELSFTFEGGTGRSSAGVQEKPEATSSYPVSAGEVQNRPGSAAAPDSDSIKVPSARDLEEHRFTYKGQLFDLFLLVEYEDIFYIIDQHAAHERVLFETFSTAPAVREKLLIPVPFSVTPYEAEMLKLHRDDYHQLGIDIEETAPGSWQLIATPSTVSVREEELIEAVKASALQPDELRNVLYTTLSCRQAVKDRVTLDRSFAEELIKAVFSLDNARCPHGRPLWYAVTRKELYYFVGRL